MIQKLPIHLGERGTAIQFSRLAKIPGETHSGRTDTFSFEVFTRGLQCITETMLSKNFVRATNQTTPYACPSANICNSGITPTSSCPLVEPCRSYTDGPNTSTLSVRYVWRGIGYAGTPPRRSYRPEIVSTRRHGPTLPRQQPNPKGRHPCGGIPRDMFLHVVSERKSLYLGRPSTILEFGYS